MRIFVLDDMESRIESFVKWYGHKHELVVAKDADEAITILSKDLAFDVLFLDHDLGDRIFVDVKDENTGSRVAKFLSDKKVEGMIIVHSWNPVGAKNMLAYLSKAIYIPISCKEAFGIE